MNILRICILMQQIYKILEILERFLKVFKKSISESMDGYASNPRNLQLSKQQF